MLLTIHNLPASTRYADIKSLLQSKCGLQHVILDNLLAEGMGKKVTVGVAEDADAAILVRKINGLYWNEQQLYVEDVRQQKTASEQPFRVTNPQLQDSSDQSFRSMNLQQHSSFNPKGMGMSNMMTPAVQPMMTAMYYMPDYTSQDYMQSVSNMQTGNYMQSQNYEQVPQKVQSAYMGISGFSQTATQISQVGVMSQFNKNQDLSQPETQGSGWGDSYNEEDDFAAERPLFGRRSPAKNEVNWFPNQQRRQETPPRDRSRDNREQAWAPRGSDTRGLMPTQPGFRSTIRPDDRSGFTKPRPNERPALLPQPHPALLPKPRPEFGFDARRQNQFSGRPNEFSGRPNERQGKSNEHDGYSERSEFSARSNRSSERRGPNEFSGRPNEFSGRSNEREGRQSEHQRRPNEYQGRPNERERRQNEHQRRPNEYQGRPNEYQGRPNEFAERKGRQNDRPAFSRPNDRAQFGRTNERDEFVRSNVRTELSRPSERDSRPERSIPDSRKRKFDERFDDREIERPERVSRPKVRQQPLRSNKPLEGSLKPMTEAAKAKLSKRMFAGGVRKIVYDIYVNLNIQDPDLITRQTFRMLVTERLEIMLGGRSMVPPPDCFEIYRSMYPAVDDKATYNAVLTRIAQLKANETLGIVAEVAAPEPKHVATPKPATLPEPEPMTAKQAKAERDANRKLKEAKHLLSQGKVPRFPQGDRRNVAQQKKEEKEGHIPEVESPYKAAIEEEVNKIADLFVYELNNAPTPKQQKAYNTVDQIELTAEIKKNLIQTLSKRISDSGLKVVRVYGHPKLPKREVLEKFLLRFGVQSLRKSVKAKMYTAAVDTYKNYDKLCAKEPVPVGDGITISFKPFHLAPKHKADQRLLRTIRNQIVQEMIDKSGLNLLDKDWPVKEAQIKEQQALEAEEAEKRAEAKKQAASKAEKQTVSEAQKQATSKSVSEAEKQTASKAEKQAVSEAEKQATEAEKQAILEAEKKKAEPLNTTDKVDLADLSETSKDFTKDYTNDDFHLIDEVHEADSDVEFTGYTNDTQVVNIDEDDDENIEIGDDENNDVENGVDLTNYYEDDVEDVELSDKVLEDNEHDAADVDIDDGDFDIDNVDVDIDDVNDDDLEDY